MSCLLASSPEIAHIDGSVELRRSHVRLRRPAMLVRTAQTTRWSCIEEGDDQVEAEKVPVILRTQNLKPADSLRTVCRITNPHLTIRWLRVSSSQSLSPTRLSALSDCFPETHRSTRHHSSPSLHQSGLCGRFRDFQKCTNNLVH